MVSVRGLEVFDRSSQRKEFITREGNVFKVCLLCFLNLTLKVTAACKRTPVESTHTERCSMFYLFCLFTQKNVKTKKLM